MVQMTPLLPILSHNYNKEVFYMGMIWEIGFSTAHSNISLLFDVLSIKDEIFVGSIGKIMVSGTCYGILSLLGRNEFWIVITAFTSNRVELVISCNRCVCKA